MGTRNIVKSFKEFKNKRMNSSYLNLFKEAYLLVKLSLNKNKRKSKNKSRILIINTCLVGEFIASLHALKYFIDKHKTDIDLVVSPTVKPLAKRIKGIKTVFSVESIYNREIEKRKKRRQKHRDYDFILVMRLSKEAYGLLKNMRYNRIKTSVGPYLRYGFYLAKNLSNKEKIKQWREVNFEVIGKKELNKKIFDFDDIFNFDKSDFDKVNKLEVLKGKSKKRVVIHTGSGWPIVQWDKRKWVGLLKKIHKMGDFQFIFIGGTEQEKKCFDYIKKGLNFKIYSVIRKLDIKELALFMKKCNYFIGVDSGPRNLAHLINLPSVCLLGPGPKHYMPLNRKNTEIIDKSNCRCTSFFCYRKKTCMENISVNEVFNKFKRIISKTKK